MPWCAVWFGWVVLFTYITSRPNSPQFRLILSTSPSPNHHHQGIKAVRDEVAAFITARDGKDLLAADPEQVRWGILMMGCGLW